MPAPKKATVTKKVTSRKTSAAADRKPGKNITEHRSLRLTTDRAPFLTFKLTRQTLYWAIIGVVIFFFATWIIHLQMQIQDIYNQIDADNTSAVVLPSKVIKH